MIGDCCFGSVQQFVIDGLAEVTWIEIGEESFTCTSDYDDHMNERKDCFRILNCPKLRFVQIGDHSFSKCHSVELRSLPSLQSISFGAYCYYQATSFLFDGQAYANESCRRSSQTTVVITRRLLFLLLQSPLGILLFSLTEDDPVRC